jgi:hypothetical protein
VGYTSFLSGPSQKAATAHFHVENHVESGILWAAAECAHNLKKNEWMECDPIRWNLELWISFGIGYWRWLNFWWQKGNSDHWAHQWQKYEWPGNGKNQKREFRISD